MKKFYSFLIAAIALLAFFAVPLRMSAAEGDVHDMNISQSTQLNNNASIPPITIPAQSYPVKAVTINWKYNKATANVVTIEVTVNGNSWGTQSVGTNTTANAVFEGTATRGEIIISFTNNAGSGTGKGTFYVNSVKLTEGASNPTYTLTDGSGNNGSISFVPASPVEEGTHVTLTPTPASEAYYFAEDSWSFFNDDLDDVTTAIEFVDGEDNTIVMPAYNLTVDATFEAKPTYAITCASNNETWGALSASPAPAYQGQTVTLSYLPETGYRLSSIVITKTDDGSATSITPVESGDSFTFEMPNYAVTATATFEAIPSYTITFDAGSGTCNTTTMSGLEGSAINLPTATPSQACVSRGWKFAGWATASVSETTTTPTLLNGDYTITADADLYAVYQVTENVNTISDVVLANGDYDSDNNIITWTESYVTIVQSKGTSSNFGNYVSSPRWYVDNVVTITPISTVINSIVIEQSSNDYNGLINSNTTYENASVTANGNTANITPTDGAQAITIVLKKQSRPTSISINYSSGTTTYNSNPECVMRYGLTLPSNAEVHLFDGNEIEIETENGTALIEGGTEVRVSIDHVADCQLFESLSINPESGTVTVNEIGTGYYSFIMPSCNASIVVSTTSATPYTLNIDKPSQVSFDGLLVGWDSDVISDFPASICELASVLIDGLSVSSGYFLKSVTLTYGDETVELNKEIGVYSFTMPAANATLTFEVRDAASYTLVTSTEQLVPGKHYIIASSKEAGNAKAMSYDRGNNRYAEDVTVSSQNNKTSISEVNGLYEFAISGEEDNYTIYDKNEKGLNVGNTYGYLHSTNGNSNYLKTTSNLTTAGSNGYWSITIDAAGKARIYNSDGGKNVRYNSSSKLFSCYGSSTDQGDVYLYVKADDNDCDIYSATNISDNMTITGYMNIHAGVVTVKTSKCLTVEGTLTNATAANLIIEDGGQLVTSSSNVAATVKKNIEKSTYWGNATTYTPDGWYFIASPVNEAAFPNGTVNDQDIYQLDWTNDKWLNLQIQDNSSLLDGGFTRGTGYLYANKDGNTISVAGEILPLSNNNNATITLANDGWNLIGNPLTCKVAVSVAFSALNNGSSVSNMNAQSVINPCEGIAVYGNAGTTVTFTKATAQNSAAPGNNAIQMTVAQNVVTRGNTTSSFVDNAIISFNESNQLPKFNMLEGNAKLYIPQNGKEFAIVSSEAQGETPVNFKANQSGEYTISINTENVEMNYLHLIDNLTGNDVDLLATPSYTFNAKTDDYASRFRLVFSANNANNGNENDHFAFISNGQIVLTEEGNAQVFDIMGRMVSSHNNVNHISTEGLAAGVYVIRLTNGNETMTQKIVVK